MTAALMKIHHNELDEYPAQLKKEILEALGNIDHLELFGEEVMCAAFVSSPFHGKTQILKGDNQQNEDKWQGKSFLVVKLGDQVEAACKRSGRRLPKVGSWYWGFPSEVDNFSTKGIGAKSRKDPKDETKNLRPWGDAGWPMRLILVGDIRGLCGNRPQDIM